MAFQRECDVKCIEDVLSEFLPLSEFIRIDHSEKTIAVEDNTILVSPGPSRFANAGRPARTGMIRRIFLTQSHYFPVPPRLKPVNSPAEAPPAAAPRPGRDLVYRNTAGTHRVFTGIRPRQSYGNAPAVPR
ncbi:hypothetical protein DPMN_164626 [Dreissena polymorpha]|uniref:Uncharacterized protein n=1 Tax=Dreissena polymorpha TaxID=45954 RepID=A0A9D4ETA5_DREPO|nr:hypothetical protein DPMN_164626 [Dreissena polymorpha]